MFDWIGSAWNALPEPLRDPVALAIPAFVALLALEWFAAAKLEEGSRGSYKSSDARASLGMGLVSVATTTAWKTLALFGYTALYAYVAPWQLPADAWYTWVILILGVDFLFYAYHRLAHRTRIIWATHQAHHSSEYFNFSTALRQKWNNSGEILMWLPLPLLGVPPWMVFTGFGINLVYQFWVHTERIDKLPRAIEFVFNTPSHHRVHHGRDPQYLDKNYGGILIVWDRLFGTYADEAARPHYGLTKPVGTYNIWTLQTHEYRSIARDVAASRSWKDRLGFVLGPPGWTPSERRREASSNSG
ncbi:MAG: sterol desaturase family protein [Rhodococcus sp. (in: high G+C Gram-positive bacteria)]